MSGAKSYGYAASSGSSVSAAELERQQRERELAAAWAEADAERRRLERLLRDIAIRVSLDPAVDIDAPTGLPFEPSRTSSTIESVRAHITEVRELRHSLSSAFSERVREVVDERAEEAVHGGVTGQARTASEVLDVEYESGADIELATNAKRIAARMHPEAAPEFRDRADLLLRELTGADLVTSESSIALLELRHVVQEANRSVDQRRRDADEAVRLLARMASLDADHDGLESQLTDVVDGTRSLDEELRTSAQGFLDQFVEERERGFVSATVHDVLADLGYETEKGFDTLVVDRGYAHFRRADWGDYAVRFRLDTETRQVRFNVVRPPGDPGRNVERRDREVETMWCDDLPEIREGLAVRGLRTELDHAYPAGAMPVQVTGDLGLPVDGARRQTRRLREREIPS